MVEILDEWKVSVFRWRKERKRNVELDLKVNEIQERFDERRGNKRIWWRCFIKF